MVKYFGKTIAERKWAPPRSQWGMTADGYTKRSGAPTAWMIRLEGESRWRRLMCWQFSNAGTLFVKFHGLPRVVRDCDLPPEKP